MTFLVVPVARALLLASLLSGCASYSGVRFAPAVQDTELRGESGDLQAHLTVAWRALEEREGKPELCFRVRVENPGASAFTLVPAEFELLDAALSPFGPARASELPVLLEPGQASTFELAFSAPDGADFKSFDLAALTLTAHLQGGRWNWSTTFERVVPEPHSSPFSFGLGVGWVIH